jgi:hypothetical protein
MPISTVKIVIFVRIDASRNEVMPVSDHGSLVINISAHREQRRRQSRKSIGTNFTSLTK